MVAALSLPLLLLWLPLMDRKGPREDVVVEPAGVGSGD
jgi:hypothetical protein